MTFLATIYDEFSSATNMVDNEIDTLSAAAIIAKSNYRNLNIEKYERQIEYFAETLENSLPQNIGNVVPANLVTLINGVFFNELNFKGDVNTYENPQNLYINNVIDARKGIPISLALIYSEICNRVGLDVQVIGLPGHVICRYNYYSDKNATTKSTLLIDVFNNGRVISERDCNVIIKNTFGAKKDLLPHYLSSLTPRQILMRILLNLKTTYLRQGNDEDALRIIQLKLSMFYWDLDEIRDRGMIYERLGQNELAIQDLQQYVAHRSEARDIDMVKKVLKSLQIHSPNFKDLN